MAESPESNAGSRVSDKHALKLAAVSVPLWGLMILSSATRSLKFSGDAGSVIEILLQFGILLLVGLSSLLYLVRSIIYGCTRQMTAVLVIAIASHGLVAALCCLLLLVPA